MKFIEIIGEIMTGVMLFIVCALFAILTLALGGCTPTF